MSTDPRNDAVSAVEVGHVDAGAEGSVVQREIVIGTEQVLYIAGCNAVSEAVGEKQALAGQQSAVAEVRQFGDAGW